MSKLLLQSVDIISANTLKCENILKESLSCSEKYSRKNLAGKYNERKVIQVKSDSFFCCSVKKDL